MADGLKLSALLPNRLDEVGARARQKLCENKDVGAMTLAWDYIGSELNGALGQALDCDLMEELAKGWANADLLASFADPAKHAASDRSVVEFAAHEIKRELKPVIAVTIGSCPCVEIEFGFAVSAHFSGVQLTITDRHITGGRAGEAWASAQLSCQGTPLHDAAETRKFPIPGTFQFKPPGVPLLPAASRSP
jgi:hypothetical protein